jgi:hypothetical protein
MTARDVRPHIVADALAHPTLAHARRIFLITVTMLPAEYDETGQRRPGSKGMDARGHFALHYDYLAKWLHTSAGNAKRTAERLAEGDEPFLRKVHPGTFGRPATWQALRVRGDWSRRITPSTTVTPYDLYAAYVRSDHQSPLPYRTPTGLNPAPAVGDLPEARTSVDGSNEREVCQWHGYASPCPSDCADHPTNRQESA